MKGMQMPDVSLKREYVVRLPVAIPRYQRKRTRYTSERERRELIRLCRFLLFRLYVLNKRGEDKKTPSLSPHTQTKKRVRQDYTVHARWTQLQPQGDCCCCGCGWPGLGKTEMVSNCSRPPMVACGAFCQPWPVCWLTNIDCLKGFVPVAWTCSGAALLLAVCGRAKGLVPVACACSGWRPVCCCCCCCCWAKGEVDWG